MFLWGTATASYQIEGGVTEDGRGPSVWDTFAHEPGRVRDGHTGDVACDHYHRWPEDIALMADLGVDSYRFSIAWPRIQPDGKGPANPAGLDFYDRLVDGLREKGIVPAATLFHWDLPQALQDEGGWLARDTASRFADYAALVAERLADRVPMWITLNEPFVHMAFGYAMGAHAPGLALLTGALPAAHHQLLGHGLATAALRANGAGQVLITNNCTPVWPASDDPADLAAAEAYDILHNRLFNDPVLLGRYPDLSAYGPALDCVRDGDLDLISAPLDGLGINYYNPTRIAAPGGDGLPFTDAGITGYPVTAFGWPVVPDGLRELLTGLKARYGDALPPVYVTENGCSQPDEPGPGGTVDDQARIAYLDGHIRAVEQAAAEGVDVRGYYVWSLLDNFEWAEGYHQRFGLVHVDFATQRRTPKASYHWFKERIARR
ncbi:GH1 family beta-glucosidase [Planobispora longispora]|uniref:Beta-glucosidase n=1 Tax=Planobispora longispora TaxID=28887 RepID=A0A8J3W7A4_9ACTN|nr:GH1 family beta-glucosidase [Planobispora longispora]BFE82896.1 GH1 family beta-glucosidase [Planobispora longispora]GIH78617.1 beta-glucosidase [Planobispora longispora]